MRRIFTSTLGLVMLLPGFSLFAQDRPGSKDHPLITRYPGTTIVRYDTKDFDEYQLVLGVEKNAPSKVEKVEGTVTRIVYRPPTGRSTLEVYRNFEQAVQRAGGQILWTCTGQECGAPTLWTRVNGLGVGGAVRENRYLAAKISKPGSLAYVGIHVGTQLIQVHVCEPKAMDSGLVTVNANALAEGLDRDGHIAVYAILFDTGRATLRPESDAALREIATLLRNRPSLRLHVVGHTDSTGNFDSNMQLSVGRAQAVVAALTSSHGVAAARLRAHGVGPLTPVATNSTEDGKQLNRRVELVAQN